MTELELCGLAINIAGFSHLLKRVDFDVIVDHLSLTHIIKSNVEPVTIRIKRLLELISTYSFNLYYIKGKDMVLSDFLSRQNNDNTRKYKEKILLNNYGWSSIVHSMRYYLFPSICANYMKNIIIQRITWEEFRFQHKTRKNNMPIP